MLFLIMGNSAIGETPLDELKARVVSLLPTGWSVQLRSAGLSKGRSFDAELELASPAGETAVFQVAAKRWTTAPSSSVAGVLVGLRKATTDPVLLVTDYTNPPLRQACEDLGISYIDSTGWVYLATEKPTIFVRTAGGSRGPRPREVNEITRLNGKAAGRLIRTLLTARPPIGVRELAQRAGTSPGSAAKLLPTLAREGAVERDTAGRITSMRRRVLLERWTADYSYLKSNGQVRYCVAPRGIPRAIDSLTELDGVCVTGSAAARTFLPPATTPVVPITTLMLYARNPDSTASSLGLVDTDRSAANVLLTVPRDLQLVDQPERSADGLQRAPLGVALADLLSMPGRSAQEADQLMDSLASTDPSWGD
jgi:hypothetical protein